jgi:hypothetical protein
MKLVITQHRPLRRLLTAAAFIGAAVLAVAIALDYGHWRYIAEAMVSTGKKRELLHEVAQLREEREDLEFEITRLHRTEDINRKTREDNHQQLVRLQSEIAVLNQELEFYRDVVGAAEVNAGPKVRGIQFKTLVGDGRYSYRLVLTYVDKDDRVAEGKLDLGFRGEFEGQRKALSFSDVKESGPDSLSFKFKHFRLFEGTIKMPQGFVPQQIHVAVLNKRKAKGSFSEMYDWPSVLN